MLQHIRPVVDHCAAVRVRKDHLVVLVRLSRVFDRHQVSTGVEQSLNARYIAGLDRDKQIWTLLVLDHIAVALLETATPLKQIADVLWRIIEEIVVLHDC